MKKLLFVCCAALSLNSVSQDWEDLGGFGYFGTTVQEAEIVVKQNGHPVVAYQDINNFPFVYAWDGVAWVNISAPFFNACDDIQIATTANIVYFGAYNSSLGYYEVYKYESGSWTPIGDLSGYSYNVGVADLAVSDNIDDLTLGLRNASDNMLVLRYQAGAWSQLGNDNFCTLGTIPSVQKLKMSSNGTTYYTYQEEFDMAGAMPVFDPVTGLPLVGAKSGFQPDVRVYTNTGSGNWDWHASTYLFDNPVDFDGSTRIGQNPILAGTSYNSPTAIDIHRAEPGTMVAVPSFDNVTYNISEVEVATTLTDEPIFVYTDAAPFPNSQAMKFNGSTWDMLGDQISATYAINSIELAMAPQSNKPYVLYNSSLGWGVKTLNNNPQAVAGPPSLSICNNGLLQNLASGYNFTDADNDSLYLVITSSDPSIITDANISWIRMNSYSPASDQNIFEINATPEPGQTGSLNVTVKIIDGFDTLDWVLPVTVNLVPTVSAGSDINACQGSMINLTASNPDGASLSWDNGVFNAVPFILTTGGTYSVTATLAGCSSTDAMNITMYNSPVFNITPTSPSECGYSDGSLTFSGLDAATGYTLNLYVGPSLFGPYNYTTSGTGTFVHPNQSANTYGDFTLISSYGCTAMFSGPVNILDANVPNIDAGPDITVCEGTPVTLIANNPNNVNISWDNGITNGVAFYPTTSGTYTVTGTSGNCTSSSSVIVDVLNSPDISFSTTPTTCGNENGAVDATISGGTGPYTLYWSNGATTEDISSLPPSIYYLNVTDINGCYSMAPANVSVTEVSVVGVVTPVTCHDGEDGSIDINITGVGPFEYSWSNGAITEDITDLAAGQYEVFVVNANNCGSTASFIVTQPDEISADFAKTPAACATSDGQIVATIGGGTAPYSVSWYDNNDVLVGTNPTLSLIPSGAYDIKITDNAGCETTLYTWLNNPSGPEINFNSITPSSCANDGAIDLSATSSLGAVSFEWSSGESTEDIIGKAPDTYSVTVTDVNGCSKSLVGHVLPVQPEIIPICIVTVDTNTNTNLVVWEKPIVSNISHFNVYRESSVAGLYQFVDSVLYSEESLLNDTIAYPSLRSWRYKLTVVNDCGVESEMSDDHKTIHLVFDETTPGNYVLSWDDYEGFAYSEFHVWRYTLQNDWEEIAVVSSATNTLDDSPTFVDDLDYMIEILPPSTCQSSTGKVQDHNSSRSNKSASVAFDNGSSDLPELEQSNIEIYPNPTTGVFWVNVDHSQFDIQQVFIYDMAGNLVENVVSHKIQGVLVDLSHSETGVYLVQIQTAQGNFYQKVIRH